MCDDWLILVHYEHVCLLECTWTTLKTFSPSFWSGSSTRRPLRRWASLCGTSASSPRRASATRSPISSHCPNPAEASPSSSAPVSCSPWHFRLSKLFPNWETPSLCGFRHEIGTRSNITVVITRTPRSSPVKPPPHTHTHTPKTREIFTLLVAIFIPGCFISFPNWHWHPGVRLIVHVPWQPGLLFQSRIRGSGLSRHTLMCAVKQNWCGETRLQNFKMLFCVLLYYLR